MKATGIIRRIDDLGRVVIPKEIRHTLHIREGDALELWTGDNGTIMFKKYDPKPEIKDAVEDLINMLSDEDTLRSLPAESVCAVKAVLQILQKDLTADVRM